MIRRLFQFFFGMIAVLLMVIAVFLLTFRFKIANSNLYKAELDKSGIFNEVDNIGQYLNTDQNDAQLFLKPLLDQLDFKTLLRKTLFLNLDYLSNWVNGRDDFYIYFPKEDLKGKITSSEFRGNVLNTFEQNLSNLPTCANDSELDTFQPGQNGDYIPSCKPSNFSQIFAESRIELESRLETILANQDLIEESLAEAGYSGIGEKTSKDTILSLIESEEDKKQFINVLDKVEKGFSYGILAGLVLIILSVIFTLFVVLLAKNGLKGYLINFSNVYLFAGLQVITISAAVKIAIPRLTEFLQERLATQEVQAEELILKFLKIGENILLNIYNTVFVIGILLFLVFLTLRIGTTFIKNQKEDTAS